MLGEWMEELEEEDDDDSDGGEPRVGKELRRWRGRDNQRQYVCNSRCGISRDVPGCKTDVTWHPSLLNLEADMSPLVGTEVLKCNPSSPRSQVVL